MGTISNETRAEWASRALESYSVSKEGGTGLYDDPASVITDLLADLRHYCKKEGLDFEAMIGTSLMHFEDEQEEARRSRLRRGRIR